MLIDVELDVIEPEDSLVDVEEYVKLDDVKLDNVELEVVELEDSLIDVEEDVELSEGLLDIEGKFEMVDVVLEDGLLDVEDNLELEGIELEPAEATYKFKTDLPPQYSFALSAQTILQGLAFVTVLELTDPALRTFPQ